MMNEKNCIAWRVLGSRESLDGSGLGLGLGLDPRYCYCTMNARRNFERALKNLLVFHPLPD